MIILIASKYVPSLRQGANPRWFELGKLLIQSNNSVHIITSDSNHVSGIRPEKHKTATLAFEGVIYNVIQKIKYSRTANIGRVISWFDNNRYSCVLLRQR